MSTKISKSSVNKAPYSSRSSSVAKVFTKRTETKTTSKTSAKKAETKVTSRPSANKIDTKTVSKNSTKKTEIKDTMKKPESKTQSKAIAKISVKSTGSKENGKSKGTTDVRGGDIGILMGAIVGVVNTNGPNQNIATNNNNSNMP